MKTFRISALNIYPIKSCGGIGVSEAAIVERGFLHDRRWMVTDKSGIFLTQRSHPRLALVRISLDGSQLHLSATRTDDVHMPVELRSGSEMTVEVWGNRVQAVRAGLEVEEWFSSFLGTACRVVYMPDKSVRPLHPRYSQNNEHIAFSDAFPFLLLSEASLADLNTRLPAPVSMNRFRPNIVVADCPAYAEDTWKEIQIGPVPFRVAKPCARCATITVNQETGIKESEPLRTLAAYRTVDGEAMFGQNLVHRSRGILRVGDSLEVLA